MRFFTTALTALAAVSVASAASLTTTLGATLTEANHYGAPTPPGQDGCKPGWYYGDFPDVLENVCPWLKDNLICELLELLPLGLQCPKPAPSNPGSGSGSGCTVTDYKCAIQAEDYLTYGLVDTVEGCDAMCKGVKDCNFYNTYHDNNAKDSTKLTCALFRNCHDAKDAINCGGQTQKDGSKNYITESQGFCLSH